MVYLITYDLNKAGKNYDALYDAIQDLPGVTSHHPRSTWFVETTLSTHQIYDRLKPALDNDDNVLVIRVHGDYQGWMPQSFWDWMNARSF